MLDDLIMLFYNLFGSGIIMVLVIIAFITIWLLTVRASIGVIIAILFPMIIGFILAGKSTNMAYMPAWIFIPILMIMAFIFGFMFIKSIRG